VIASGPAGSPHWSEALSDPDRINPPRVASLLLVLGLVIFIVSLGVLAYGDRDVQRSSQAAGGDSGAASPALVGITWMRATFWLAILMFAFVIALSAFLRWSRNYRRRLLRTPPEPTPYTDAWAMHRLPDDATDDET
jgi:hypothetical protein